MTSLWTIVACLGVALNLFVKPVDSIDSWWPMAAARRLTQSWDFRAPDAFSFTQTGAFFPFQPWLSGVILYGLHGLGGFGLIYAALGGLLAATVFYFIGYLKNQNPARARWAPIWVTLLLIPLCSPFFCVRTQTLVIPVFVAFLLICHGAWTRSAVSPKLKLLPWLMLLWVNMHGSFVLGLFLAAVVLSGRLARRLRVDKYTLKRSHKCRARGAREERCAAGDDRSNEAPGVYETAFWIALAGLATLVNPLGWGVYRYVAQTLASPAVRLHSPEWQTIRPAFGAVAYLFYAAALLALAVIYRGFKGSPVTTSVLACFLAMALAQERHMLWFSFALMLALAETWPVPDHSAPPPRRFLNFAVVGGLTVICALNFPGLKALRSPRVDSDRQLSTPGAWASLDYLKALNPRPTRLFHDLDASGVMMWAFPEQKVFIDARLESYSPAVDEDYLALSRDEPRADGIFAKYRIDGLLLKRGDQDALIRRVDHDARWKRVYQDQEYGVWLPQK